jgi:arsenate reductase-like glutaredoxin family protein
VQASSRKDVVDESNVDSVLDGVADVYSTKSRKVIHLNIKEENPAREDVLALLMGRSGTLRAPVIKHRSALIVGFDEETYTKVLT